jgi:hypothetical protein
MQALKCCIVKLYILQSNNLLFNPAIVIVCVSSIIVQYITILSIKVQNYFEVMIKKMIAVVSYVQRNNEM